jgi:mannose-6-phosphate isomerase-like protein (cupin superfamily)
MTDTNFIRVLDYAQSRADKAFKYTFLQSDRLLVGLNCLLPGQGQHLHEHATQDKFYFVLEGTGEFTVGETTQHCSSGELILAPAGVPHGVENHGPERLSFLTVIAPFPSS